MSRTSRRSLTTALLAAGVGAVLVACQGTTPNSQPTTTPMTTEPTATTSASASPTEDPKTEATRLAEQVVNDYFALADESIQNPTDFDVERFKDVAITTALADLQNRHQSLKDQGLEQTGDTQLTSVTASIVDLTAGEEIVEFRVCYDVSDVNVVDEDGKSVVPADREPLGVARVGVTNQDYPEGEWLVGFVEYLEEETC